MNTDQIKRENEAMYDMTIMHDPPKAIGNCFQACVASLLGLPLAEVPHFCEPVRHWERRFHQWLAARDLFAVEASLKVPDSLFLSPRTMCILTGDSPLPLPRACDALASLPMHRASRIAHVVSRSTQTAAFAARVMVATNKRRQQQRQLSQEQTLRWPTRSTCACGGRTRRN